MTQKATQNLQKMQEAVEELKKVNMITRHDKRMEVHLLAPLYDKAEWDDEDYCTWVETEGQSSKRR